MFLILTDCWSQCHKEVRWEECVDDICVVMVSLNVSCPSVCPFYICSLNFSSCPGSR